MQWENTLAYCHQQICGQTPIHIFPSLQFFAFSIRLKIEVVIKAALHYMMLSLEKAQTFKQETECWSSVASRDGVIIIPST